MDTPVSIDYTNKDFASLRQAMLALARYRLPEWTDQSPADLGMVLLDMFAYMGDVILYYQDRIANNLFPLPMTERRAAQHLLRLIGYEMGPPQAAAADLDLLFNPPAPAAPTLVVVPSGVQFASQPGAGGAAQTFEYLGPNLNIDLASAQVRPVAGGKLLYPGLQVRHGQSRPLEIIGSSTGEPNQSFRLAQSPLILETLVVEVNEGAGWIPWDRRESLLFYTDSGGRVVVSGPESRDFTVQFDEHDAVWVIFGDGIYGRIPPAGTNNLRATYHTGGGAVGNVPARAITVIRTAIPQLASVTNPLPAAGGADHETVDHAVRFGPLAYRSGQRAVTLSDYEALAMTAGGVARAKAHAVAWNQVDLYVAPEGDTCAPPPEDLKKRLQAFFEDRRMAGTLVRILDPLCVPIDIAIEVTPAPHFPPDGVRQAVENAVRDLLAYRNMDFGQSLFLSAIYGALKALPGVIAVTVTRFRRQDSVQADVEIARQAEALMALPQIQELVRRALELDVEADGRIEIDEEEIPTIGVLTVTLIEGVG